MSLRVGSAARAARAAFAARMAPSSTVRAPAPSRTIIGSMRWAGTFKVKTFNELSPKGLATLNDRFEASPDHERPHAILLRSYKLQEEDVPSSVRAIVRCGAGTNNCNVPRMTELGVPVFNTPGANANSVKELVLCALFLSSRGIVQGINHMHELGKQGLARERVEKDKKMFAGQEVKGKTLGVVGLGAIGALVAESALALGMDVVGYDPALTMEAALRLPGKDVETLESIPELMSRSDYVTLHAPYIANATHHMINSEALLAMKPGTKLLNFARGELVDEEALRKVFDAGSTGFYITDFPSDALWDHPQCMVLPHLGASTAEAEENSAVMAAETLMSFLQTGNIRHSVNFPTTTLPRVDPSITRICIIHKNQKGVLAGLLGVLSTGDINVEQQINTSRGDIAYTVVDIEKPPSNLSGSDLKYKSWKKLAAAFMSVDGVLSTRMINGTPGTGYNTWRGSDVADPN